MVQAIILDLDNTIYPASSSMEANTVRLMNDYVAKLIDKPIAEAVELRRQRMPNYGTTLEWLMKEYGFSDYNHYFSYVHPDDEDDLIDYDPKLKPFLDSINLPKYIFTNAPMEHADRVLKKLKVAECFEAVFDIRFCELKGKPHASAVDKVIAATGIPASNTVFADDIPRYVHGFINRGGRGLLVDMFSKHRDSGLNSIKSIYELVNYL